MCIFISWRALMVCSLWFRYCVGTIMFVVLRFVIAVIDIVLFHLSSFLSGELEECFCHAQFIEKLRYFPQGVNLLCQSCLATTKSLVWGPELYLCSLKVFVFDSILLTFSCAQIAKKFVSPFLVLNCSATRIHLIRVQLPCIKLINVSFDGLDRCSEKSCSDHLVATSLKFGRPLTAT